METDDSVSGYSTTSLPYPARGFSEANNKLSSSIALLYDEVAAFDGSVYLDRTRGEASGKCDSEEMNLLSLILLNDIVTGRRDVQGAKLFYAQTAEMFMKNKISSPYIEGLLFPKQHNTADPDVIYFR